MTIFLVDGVFELIGCCSIKDPRDDFIRFASIDRMMDRQIAFSKPVEDFQQYHALEEADEAFRQRVNHFGAKPIPWEIIPKDRFEKSAPGYIYLVDSIHNMRIREPGKRILILLKDPTQDMYLDITIDPYKFGYGLELPDSSAVPEHTPGEILPDTDPSVMAWLAVEPGIANPLKIEQVEYVNRDYMHHMVYQ